MIRFEYNHDNFDRNSSSNHNLSILTGMDSFIFMITDESGAILVLKDFFVNNTPGNQNQYILSIQDLFKNEALLQLSYKKVIVEISDHKFVFVPDRLFNASEAAVYLSQATTLAPNEQIAHTEFQDLHSNLVFCFPKELADLIQSKHPKAQWNHIATSLQQSYAKNQAYQPTQFIGLHFRGNLEYISLVNNGVVQFHNCYGVKEAQDALYFLLLVADNVHANPEETPVVWSGDLVPEAEILKLVKRYFRTVQPLETGPFQSSEMQENKYPDLLGIIS
ncbi:MAG: DUF3822 family protein [Saprospiraceae bacterium]|nr:DUF3822 family protein [Saprospiraceae bacterium]